MRLSRMLTLGQKKPGGKKACKNIIKLLLLIVSLYFYKRI